MGIFDLFGKQPKSNTANRIQREFDLPIQQTEEKKNGPVSVFSPTSYDDVQAIIDAIKSGKTAVVHFSGLKTETAIRVLDMLSGAIYALDGGVYEMERNIFMFSPMGVEMK